MSKYLIPSTENIKNSNLKTSIYIIDSRERDISKYPNPSNYKIKLEQDYTDIESLELISYSMPSKIYNINDCNNVLNFTINKKKYKIYCDIGIYEDPFLLVKNIHQKISKISNEIIVNYDSIKHKVRFSSKNIRNHFTLNFNNNKNYPNDSIAPILGFKPLNYSMVYEKNIGIISLYEHNKKTFSYLIEVSIDLEYFVDKCNCYLIDKDNNIYQIIKANCKADSNYYHNKNIRSYLICLEKKLQSYPNICDLWINSIESTNIIDLYYDKYILLEIPKSSRYSNNNKILKECFIEIPLINFIPLPSNNIIGVKKKYNPKINLSEVTIKFFRYEKNSYPKKLFNFYGGEHVLVIAINYLKQSSKYSIPFNPNLTI